MFLNIKNTIKDLEKAVGASYLDRACFYTKRVYQKTHDLIITLDLKATERPLIN
jgi:hypothetical protein